MTEPSAKVIADSSWNGHRVTTFEVVFHRFVLAEYNTHRVFSRNSASSRAIPMSLTMKQYEEDPAMPLSMPAEKAGMQGGAELEGADLEDALALLGAINFATGEYIAQYINEHEPEHRLHKSVLNRYLEPFRWHTAVVTATEWDGFWRQRVSPLAQPEMHAVAEAMQIAYEASTPKLLGYGDWHLPYITGEDVEELHNRLPTEWSKEQFDSFLKQVSVARCCRVSYVRQGEGSVEDCLKLYARLIDADPEHSSPFEHVATPCTCRPGSTGKAHLGNLVGWDQYRHEVFGR